MNDLLFMRKALQLAKKGIGQVSPNPLVGALIVKEEKIIGEGYHQYYGGPHAEINAFADAKESVAGATLYITLEPCCHYGKTGPCVDVIIEKKITKVVIAMIDPNPEVSGKGVEKLRKQGIEVVVGIAEKACRQLNESFIYAITNNKPFVLMKYAMTADGKITTNSGEGKWITNPKSRRNVHKTRNAFQAILTGINTVLIDDPLLNCRIKNGNNPIRIIVDNDLKLPEDSRIAKTAKEIPTIVACVRENRKQIAILNDLGIKVIVTKRTKENFVDLSDLMEKLIELNIKSIMIESGAILNYAALEAGIVNTLQVYIGAQIFGGSKGRFPVEGPGIEKIVNSIKLELNKMVRFDNDIMLEYKVGSKVCLLE
ncbi:MAG: bifunctional diaminohydroxyphosphoribosylaminopyrimidine deaminase/5-amino-6-(5-phosphoribosylamino)uracil reductase RibD [Erysipelotrichales bacterium]|nr:bifunctional diaminohydroxyphosphoribosylaminopyrimidine deaminase/5-amino-6-(5-phosphoribosylamino)uracil reductase RibD [Erysipelotrichales bacterium]